MNKSLFFRIIICIFVFGVCLYSYIDKQNELTELRIRLPSVAKEIKSIIEENTRLQYAIEQFENPEHLMELSRRSEWSHLKHPLLKEVLTMREGKALEPHLDGHLDGVDTIAQVKPKLTVAIGAQH